MAAMQNHTPRASSAFFGGVDTSAKVDFSNVLSLSEPEIRAVEVLQGFLKLRNEQAEASVKEVSGKLINVPTSSIAGFLGESSKKFAFAPVSSALSAMTMPTASLQASTLPFTASGSKAPGAKSSSPSFSSSSSSSSSSLPTMTAADYMATLASAAQLQDEVSGDGAESIGTTSSSASSRTDRFTLKRSMSMSSAASTDSEAEVSRKRVRTATAKAQGAKRENKSRYSAFRKASCCPFCKEIGLNCGKVAAKCPNRPCNQCGRRHRLNRCRKIGCKHCPGDHLSSKCPIKIKQWARASVARRRERVQRGKSLESFGMSSLSTSSSSAALPLPSGMANAMGSASAPPLPAFAQP